jgi:hypothetical protein
VNPGLSCKQCWSHRSTQAALYPPPPDSLIEGNCGITVGANSDFHFTAMSICHGMRKDSTGERGGGGKHPATFLSNQAEAISMYMVNSALEFLYL